MATSTQASTSGSGPGNRLHAFEFLLARSRVTPPATTILAGSDEFLARESLRKLLSGDREAHEEPLESDRLIGSDVEWRDVADLLRSASLFGGSESPVVIESADSFVSTYRGELERYFDAPAARPLILVVRTWSKQTKLARMLESSALLIECSTVERATGPPTAREIKAIAKFLETWARQVHGLKVRGATIDYLVQLVGPTLGLLDQELAKLANFVDRGVEVTKQHVDAIGSGWGLRTTWEVLDAILDGQAGQALEQVDRLFQSGQEPIAFLGAFAWSLRRFAAATQHSDWQARTGAPRDIPESLRRAGFRNDYGSNRPAKAERQLRQLGYRRCRTLYRRILQTDLRLKGSHSHPRDARRLLEELILELAAKTRS